MKGRIKRTKLSRFLWIFGRPLHPVRSVFAVTGALLLSLPSFIVYIRFRYIGLLVFVIYPLMFLFAHLVWFRLPFVKKNVRWLLFLFTLTIIIALAAGFLFMICRQNGILRAAVSIRPNISKAEVSWLTWLKNEFKGNFTNISLYFFLPSLFAAFIYTALLFIALKIYRTGRAAWYRKLKSGKGKHKSING
ncbi:MAG: hypothetical protein GXP33_01050 [Spirochaetes bacterium]|nr:hypothetical protein [Spirochaetota bacterium]